MACEVAPNGTQSARARALMVKGKSLRKVGVVAVLLVVLGWLFWQTVQDTLSEPYVIEPGLVAEWRLALPAVH